MHRIYRYLNTDKLLKLTLVNIYKRKKIEKERKWENATNASAYHQNKLKYTSKGLHQVFNMWKPTSSEWPVAVGELFCIHDNFPYLNKYLHCLILNLTVEINLHLLILYFQVQSVLLRRNPQWPIYLEMYL